MPDNRSSNYRWLMLGLSTATGTLVATLPFSCMPVLFKEISDDLSLNLVQIGSIWGIVSLSGVFVSLPAGILGDRFKINHILSLACLLIGITGALRGFSDSFFSLMVIMFVFGIVRGILPVNVTRTVGLWFRGKNLGMANGIISMGMGLGLMLGPLISATWLSPLLGGWRNVMLLYGGISALIGILWFFLGKEPDETGSTGLRSNTAPVIQIIFRMFRNKTLWLLGLTLMFRFGSIMGMSGYLPLYLRDRGWSGASADNTLASFYATSFLSVVPLSSLSDRIGSRKIILFIALLATAIAFSLIPVSDGTTIWALMIMSGMFMDAFMSAIITLLLETEEIGLEYSGTSLGVVFTISQIGGVVSPPLGNSFAELNTGLPFIFWAILSAASIFFLFFIKETGWRAKRLPLPA